MNREPIPYVKHKEYRQCPKCGYRMARRSKECLNCRGHREPIPHPDPTKRYIPLTRGMVAVIDAIDYERVSQFKWCAWKTRVSGEERFYAVHAFPGGKRQKMVPMHRFILGVTDPSIQVDHRQPEETLNNCRENLRLSTPSQNQANRKYYGNRSGYKGVHFIPKKAGKCSYDRFRGEIVVNGKRITSSLYREPITPAKWYDEMALKYFGEFARINFPHKSPTLT